MGWSARDLGSRSNTSFNTILRFERGETQNPNPSVALALVRAFEQAGVTFAEPTRETSPSHVAQVREVKLDDGSKIFFSKRGDS